MRWLSAEEVRLGLPPLRAIDAIERALRELERGVAGTSGRQFTGPAELPLAVMPGYADGFLGLKAITVAEQNPSRGLPTIQGAVLVFGGHDGQLLGGVDGPALTALRTAAIAGLATKLLASGGASRMLLLGAGAQAPAQVEAVLAVRPVGQLTLWNRSRAAAETLAQSVRRRHPHLQVDVTDDVPSASAKADIITTATASTDPLPIGPELLPHCHINAMGSYRPDRREIAADLIAKARVFADTLDGCLAEAGDLLIPIAEARLRREEVHPLLSARPGDQQQFTIMKSVGSAIFDVACASALLTAAQRGSVSAPP